MAFIDKASRGKGEFWGKDDEISIIYVVLEMPIGWPKPTV